MNGRDMPESALDAPFRLPTAEEVRMVRAIAQIALLEAARDGEYRATFRGFSVRACRLCPQEPEAFVEIKFCVSLGRVIVECGLVVTANAYIREPNQYKLVIMQ